MRKVLFIFAIGAAAGYAFGFKDSKSHEENVAVRVINRVGGSSRDRVRSDVDAKMDSVEARSR
jgi:hypothetical protein